MSGTPWAPCQRTNAHGEHDFVTPTTLGEQREHRCPGVMSDRPLPMAGFWRTVLGVRRPLQGEPAQTGGRHRGQAFWPEPEVVGPVRHCAGPTPDFGCLHEHAGASTSLPPMGTWGAEPHRCGDATCTEDHGTETAAAS